jgi:hypothetical protein
MIQPRNAIGEDAGDAKVHVQASAIATSTCLRISGAAPPNILPARVAKITPS